MKARQAKRLARTGLSLSLLVVIGAGFSSISSASNSSDSASTKAKSKYVQVVVTRVRASGQLQPWWRQETQSPLWWPILLRLINYPQPIFLLAARYWCQFSSKKLFLKIIY